jgi:hypothetical protein
MRHVPSPGHNAAPLRWQLANRRPPLHWQDARRICTAAATTLVEAPGERTSCDDDRGWHLQAFDGLLFQIRLGKKVQKDASPVKTDHNESKRLKLKSTKT